MRESAFSSPPVQSALAGPETAVLATINPDGSPLATPMWFVHDVTGIGMVSVDRLRKVRNLRRDPRVSVVVQTVPGAGMQCIIVQGVAQLVTTDRERSALGEAFVHKYGPQLQERWGGRAVPDDRVLFRIVPRRVKLWG